MLSLTLEGLALGACYALFALGFTLVYGVLRRVDMAYGATVLVGLYVALWLHQRLQGPVWLMLPAAVAGTVVAGLYVQRLCFTPHAARATATLAASFAVWMQLEEAAGLLLPRHVVAYPLQLPAASPGALLRPAQWLAIAGAACCAPFVGWLVYRTRFGLGLRALVQDREAAIASGVNPQRTALAACVLASVLGAMAGCGVAMVDEQVTPMLAMWATLKGLTAAMLGGLGHLGGALVGGLLLGVIEVHMLAQWGPLQRDLATSLLLLAALVLAPGVPRMAARLRHMRHPPWATDRQRLERRPS